MKEYLRKISVLVLIAVLVFANPVSVLADEGKGGHELEAEVNGYDVTLSSQNEWVKGENSIVVTITDSMGMAVSDAEVEILIAPKADSHTEAESDSHGASETDSHAEPAADAHASESSSHDSMSDMDEHEEESADAMEHDEETLTPLVMTESHAHGEYLADADLQKSGEHIVQVFFHVNDEMMQAEFTVDVPGVASKTLVLWSFLVINVGLVVSAGVLKNNPLQ